MIFLIYINNSTHQQTTVFYPPCYLFYFVCLKVFQNKFPSPEVNTRGKQAYGRAITQAIKYKEGTRHWAPRVLLSRQELEYVLLSVELTMTPDTKSVSKSTEWLCYVKIV